MNVARWFGVERRARANGRGEEGGGCGYAGQLDEGAPSHRVVVLLTDDSGSPMAATCLPVLMSGLWARKLLADPSDVEDDDDAGGVVY